MDISIDRVVEVLAGMTEPASATAVSREFGFSKLSAVVKRKIEEGVRNGRINEIQPSGGRNYVAYTAATVPTSVSPEEPATGGGGDTATIVAKNVPPATDSGVVDEVPKDYVLPDSDSGYTVEPVVVAKTVQGFIVTTPDGKVVEMTPTERLVVFNDDKDSRYIVGTPGDLLSAIHIYTTNAGWGTYMIRQITSQKIKPVTQAELMAGLPREVVFFLNIEQHNKAGF